MSIISVATYRTLSETPVTVPATPPSDATIQLALDRYSALIEGFTGRVFSSATYTEKHLNCGAGPLQLRQYPVTVLTSVTVGGVAQSLSSFAVDYASGSIYHDHSLYGMDATVVYTAGYATAPYDIQTTLVTLVKGYLAGSYGGAASLGAGQKEVVAGVGSIDYGTAAQSYRDFGDPYADLGPYVSVLERYREPSFA